MTHIDLVKVKERSVHFPVLIAEIMQYINQVHNTKKEYLYLDCTFGLGGYTTNILENNPNSKVIALDRDSNSSDIAESITKKHPNRFNFYHENFMNYNKILTTLDCKVDAILLDLGFSTLQLLDKNRGFSFNSQESLSMEMGLNERTAENFINKATLEQIADVIYYYGQEYSARKIARKIVEQRSLKKITTSYELANIITSCFSLKEKKTSKIHVATKTFQAIRIHINDEIAQLKIALQHSLSYLKPHGLLFVVSFHSLEDSIVKKFLSKNKAVAPEFTIYKENTSNMKFIPLNKKVILPSKEEILINKPSSSAKLRIAQLVNC